MNTLCFTFESGKIINGGARSMRLLIIGSTGTIGQAVVQALSVRHDVVKVGHSSGDLRVDISSTDSIKNG